MPRLPEIFERDQVPEGDRGHFDALVASRKAVTTPYQYLLHAPDLAARVAHAIRYVRFEAALDPRIREILTCTVAREMDCPFEWGSHADEARKLGVSEATIAAIRDRKPLKGVPSEDAMVIEYVQSLVRAPHRASDRSFNALRARLGDKQMVELTIITGAYLMLACCLNAFEVPAPPGSPALPL